jgi:hypothetical protein
VPTGSMHNFIVYLKVMLNIYSIISGYIENKLKNAKNTISIAIFSSI